MIRSGTTLVEQILASHPKVYGAGELTNLASIATRIGQSNVTSAAFPETFAALTAEQLRHCGADYCQAIRAAAPAAERIIDKMPTNFRFVGAIHLVLPNARVIHIRRDPVNTCLSCFSILFAGDQPFAYELGELGRYYRAYAALVDHWRNVLPQGVMLEIQYEELIADLGRQARRIIAHCCLDWDERCLAFHQTERPVRTASALQVRRPIYNSSKERWRPERDVLQPLLSALKAELS
jgi:hypothetical protein